MPKQPTPVYSSHADDPELRDDIDQFVVQLAEQIDRIQDALCASDLDLLRSSCSELEQVGRKLGFASLADAAALTAFASSDGKPDLAEDGVVEITQLGQRIRLGHRGAA